MSKQAVKIESQIESCLKDMGICYKKEEKCCIFDLKVPAPIREILYIIWVKNNGVTVHGSCPICADSEDPEAILRAAAFFTRVNYGLLCGNFELDMEDGEINFKVYIDCHDGQLNPTSLEKAIEEVEQAYMMCGRSIMEVVYTDASAMEAYVHMEESRLREARKMLSQILQGEDDEALRNILLTEMEEIDSCLGLDSGGK